LAKKLDEVSIVSDAARKLADKAEAAYDASATASIAAESKVLYEKDKLGLGLGLGVIFLVWSS